MTDFRGALQELHDAVHDQFFGNDIGLPPRLIKAANDAGMLLRAEPEPEVPTDEELSDLWSWAAGQDQGPWPTQQHCFARAVLSRWGK